jgi:hypothetical protein
MNANENPHMLTPSGRTPSGRTPAGRRARSWRTRSRFLAGVAAAAITAGTVIGPVLASAAPASAASGPGWIVGAGTLAGVAAQDPAVASQLLNNPNTFGAGSSLTGDPIQPGLASTPVLSYTSYDQFASDLQNGRITFAYQWVMYDPEKWTQTPLAEQQDPIKYMTLFGQLAHAHGLKVIMAPAMDLGYVQGSVIPRLRREPITSWYVRVNLAGAAAAAGDIYTLQGESQTGNLAQYDWLYTNAAAQARAANPNVKVFAEVSTRNGTTQQMEAAAQSITPDGFYVAAPNATAQATQFFQGMAAAGANSSGVNH